VLVVTHQRKSGGSHGEAVRGSSALTGGVDVVVEMERGPDNLPNVRVLRAVSRYGGTPEELAATLTDDRYEACGDLEAVRGAAERKRIEEALEALGQATSKDVADHADMPEPSARRYLNEMHERGELEREGRGVRGSPHLWSPKGFLSAREEPLVAERKESEDALDEEAA
jgi:hypothetical protein